MNTYTRQISSLSRYPNQIHNVMFPHLSNDYRQCTRPVKTMRGECMMRAMRGECMTRAMRGECMIRAMRGECMIRAMRGECMTRAMRC